MKKDYDINHLYKGLIIPKQIMALIKKWYKISIAPNELFFNNNKIFFIKIDKIIVGDYNYIPFILSEFVFIYNSDKILQSEKDQILSNEINEYIVLRKCSKDIKDLQFLKNENDEEIGKLFIINQNNKELIKDSKLLEQKTKEIPKKRNQNYCSKAQNSLKKLKKSYLNNSPKILNIENSLNFLYFSNEQNNNVNIHKLKNSDTAPNLISGKNLLNNTNSEDNLINNQINDKLSKDLENKNLEIKKLQDELSKIKNANQQLNKLNLKLKQDLDRANCKINNYKKKEFEYKKVNELKNEITKKENEFNKKMNFLEDKEKLIEKESMEIENKKKEFQKDIENKKQEINDLIKKKVELENQIKEKEKQLNNLDNKILIKNHNEQNKDNQNMDYKNNNILQNDMDLSESIGPTTLIKDINKNRNNNKIKHNQMCKNQMNIKQINSIENNNNNRLNNSKYLINAVLRCLSQTENLTNYFLKESSKEAIFNNNIAKQNKNALQLCPAYYELIHNLWSKNGIKSYSPQSLLDIIDQLRKPDLLSFRSEEAEDAEDFIIFLLEQFHIELLKNGKLNNSIKNDPINQYDKNYVFNHFFTDFQKSFSVISDIFFGVFETNIMCLFCENIYNSNKIKNPICYNYRIFNHLIFPLDEIKRMKNQQIRFKNINLNQNNIISIDECFAYYEKDVYLTGQNQIFCNLCKQLSHTKYKTKIYTSPNVLILILNREEGNETNVKLDFNESIDITRFVLQKNMPKITYNLYGVISHIVSNGPSAHFIASCKNPFDNKWYRCDDAFVEPIQNLQKEVINYGIPYILFYKKNN